MTGQVSVAAFLAARLDEDEAAAKDERVWFGPYPEDIGEFEGHLVIRDERVLREVAAKRAILGAWQDNEAERSDTEPTYTNGLADGLMLVVCYLAAVYSDHPDYRDEWKEQAGA